MRFLVFCCKSTFTRRNAPGSGKSGCVTTLESTTERLEEALRRLAVEASDLFGELLASGAELPFDLEPSDDGPLPMFSYAPLTGQFIEAHGGTVELESAIGKGTSVTIAVPRAQQ